MAVSVGNAGKMTPKNAEQTQSYTGQSTAYAQTHTHTHAHKAHKFARRASKLSSAGLVGAGQEAWMGGAVVQVQHLTAHIPNGLTLSVLDPIFQFKSQYLHW